MRAAPRDGEVLLWVYGAWVGRWTLEGWRAKEGPLLDAVVAWAEIRPPHTDEEAFVASHAAGRRGADCLLEQVR